MVLKKESLDILYHFIKGTILRFYYFLKDDVFVFYEIFLRLTLLPQNAVQPN